MKIINGKSTSEKIKIELKNEIFNLKKMGITPKLLIIQVGDNQASNTYVNSKQKLSFELGSITEIKKFSEKISEEELIDNIILANNDKEINGILVQLPLPRHINEDKIISVISSEKDVDCFHNYNVGLLWNSKVDNNLIKPCTPAGIIELLKRNDEQISGKHVVVVGRSNIVGKPVSCLFLLENATVTICHSKTKNLKEITRQADILVAAIGRPKFIDSTFINENCIVIDVGINRDENNKLCGDVNFDDVCNKVRTITPVPGGVGPMTIIMLMNNLIKVTKKQKGIE